MQFLRWNLFFKQMLQIFWTDILALSVGQRVPSILWLTGCTAIMSLLILSIIFISTYILFSVYKARKSPLTSIPGPRPLPLVGNVLKLLGPSEKVWLPLMKWMKEKYGNVVRVYFRTKPKF